MQLRGEQLLIDRFQETGAQVCMQLHCAIQCCPGQVIHFHLIKLLLRVGLIIDRSSWWSQRGSKMAGWDSRG